MNEEIEKMGKFACMVCEMGILRDGDICCSDWNSPYKCYKCQNLGKSLYDAGYRKTKVKTNGDFFRRIGGTNTDEQFANGNIEVVTSIEGKELYIARLVGEVFSTQNEAYNANLEWLKQEHKGE